jgi:hypothetical protein
MAVGEKGDKADLMAARNGEYRETTCWAISREALFSIIVGTEPASHHRAGFRPSRRVGEYRHSDRNSDDLSGIQ